MISWQTFRRVTYVGQVHKTWLLVLSLSWLALCPSLTSALTAKITYTAPHTQEGQLPDELDVTIAATTRPDSTKLHLLRVKDTDPNNIPVYTMAIDKKGHFRVNKARIDNIKNSALYQDSNNEAVIQVATDVHNKGHLLLSGDVHLGGKRFRLIPESRRRRSSTSRSERDDYLLEPEDAAAAGRRDYLAAPSEIQVSLTESATYDVVMPELSNSSSLLSLSKSSASIASASSSSSSSRKLSSPDSLPQTNRHKRQTSFYYVDVAAVIDHGIYSRFLKSAPNKEQALYDIREYFAFIFKGVDIRYQSIESLNPKISARVTKIIIAEEATASSFTESFRQPDTPWDEVDAENALNSFSEFAVTLGSDILPPYDHAMLFTGYDLTSAIDNSPRTNSTTGLAYTSTLCRTDGKSVSVVEDLGGFQAVDTAAHELGHSLSASHDGDGNGCRSSDRYIMAGGSYPETSTNRLNPWYFSPCSINYFSTFLTRTIRSSRGQTCLNLALPISPSVPNVDDELPGLKHSPDEQCRMIYGSSSRLCRGMEFGVASDVCTSMFCFDPSTAGTCYEQTAARGTVCGNGKLCLNGQCVSDSRAPAADDECVFGDQPGVAFEGQTCPDFVNTFPGYCYQAVVKGRCCASCQKAYRTVKNCEYGDTVLGCQSNACSFTTEEYWKKCCGSCNYGTPFTTKPTVSVTTTQGPPVTDPNICLDDPTIRVNGKQCSESVIDFPQFCYQASVKQLCCQSCASINSGIQGCEYGDLYPVSCSELISCDGFESQCCSSCSELIPEKSTEVPTETTESAVSSQVPTTAIATTPGTTPRGVCLDDSDIRVNSLTCQRAIRRVPSYCYTAVVRQKCCLSCRRSNSGLTGCEYGDLKPTVCQQPQSCNTTMAQIDCCSTCRDTSGVVSIHQGKYFLSSFSCLIFILILSLSNFNVGINVLS